eukprot:691980-Prorocentrum_minimum.AAC.1
MYPRPASGPRRDRPAPPRVPPSGDPLRGRIWGSRRTRGGAPAPGNTRQGPAGGARGPIGRRQLSGGPIGRRQLSGG